MNYIEQHKNNLRKNLLASYSTEEDLISKAIEADEILKGKKANIGEISEWQGKKMQKTTQGWKEIKDGEKDKKGSSDELEDLKAQLSEQESFRSSEIKTTGFVSGRTFNKITSLKKKIKELEVKQSDSKQETPKAEEKKEEPTKANFFKEYKRLKEKGDSYMAKFAESGDVKWQKAARDAYKSMEVAKQMWSDA